MLQFPVNPTAIIATNYTLLRKLKADSDWGPPITLPGEAGSYRDASVVKGVVYEYRLVRHNALEPQPDLANSWPSYISTGIDVPVAESRGGVCLVVDASVAPALATELARLEEDLIGDGWTVLRHEVPRAVALSHPNSAQQVLDLKALITADFAIPANRLQAVLLFGRLPVPYSGDIFPDLHVDHRGAWPADVFYGEMDGVIGAQWTDQQNLGTTAARPENRNPPGDGKFDQSTTRSDLELQVGRVDLSRMFESSTTEIELLRAYLNKNHNYRHKISRYARRALIDANFGGGRTEIHVWGAFTAFFGFDRVQENDWFSTLENDAYLWGFGTGAGSYTSADGIGRSIDFLNRRPKVAFTMLFGSYFGDWDNPDNFLRAPLASSDALTCAWFGGGIGTQGLGRFQPFLYPLAMGETIGYAVRSTQNDPVVYNTPAHVPQRPIHIALLGDPTLRLHVVAPPDALEGARQPDGAVRLTWTAPAGEIGVQGYLVYGAAARRGPFALLHGSGPITETAFVAPAQDTYMVKTVKLEQSSAAEPNLSGSYFNSSQGVFFSPPPAPSPPAPPSNLQATAANAERVELVWSDNATDELGFHIERSLDALTFAAAGTVEASLTTFSDTGLLPGTTYHYRVRAFNDAGESEPSNLAAATTEVLPPSLPDLWSSQDIGAAEPPGGAHFEADTFTLTATGGGLGGTSDALHFVSQTWTGNGELSATLVTLESQAAEATAGLMFRDGSDATAACVIVALRLGGRSLFQHRDFPAAPATVVAGPAASPARRLRLQRVGNVFTAYISDNGAAWTSLGSANIPLNGTLLAGMFVCSGEGASLATAEFTGVTVEPLPANNPPVISELPDQTVAEDTPTPPAVFAIGDAETATAELSLTVDSSNPALAAASDVSITGSNGSRTLIITPRPNQSGSTIISVTVSDGVLSATETLLLTVTAVNDSPTLTSLPDVAVVQGTVIPVLDVTVNDVESPAEALTLEATTSNPTLVTGLDLAGSGAARTLTITVAPGQSGSATITLTVADPEGANGQSTFNLTVNRPLGTGVFPNPAPISISDTSVVVPYPSSIEVAGLDGPLTRLTVTLHRLSHTYPDDLDVLLTGPGGRRVLLMADAGGEHDANEITLTFDDAASASLPDSGPLVSSAVRAQAFQTNNSFPPPAPGAPFESRLETFLGQPPNGTWSLFIVDDEGNDGGAVSGGWSLELTVLTPLFISELADQTALAGAAIGPLGFTVGGGAVPPASLSVAATASNPILFPAGSLQLAGGGADRSLTLTPAVGAAGSAKITVSVSDGRSAVSETFLATVRADADGDSLPDDFELANGLDPNNPADAGLDPDGDGYDSRSEFQSGTDPQNPDSRLAILETAPGAGGVRVRFTAIPGKRYRLERSETLSPAVWITVIESFLANGSVAELEDPAGSSSTTRWYRIVLLP